VPTYLETRERYQAVADLWAAARSNVVDDTLDELRLLRTVLKFRVGPSAARRRDEIGKLLGGSTRKQLGTVLSAKQKKLFAGRGWAQLLLVPFYDLPGRVHGFACVGSPEEGDRSVFWAADQRSGVAWCDNVFSPTRIGVWGDTVFVVDDVVLALRLQSRNFEESNKPLPIVAHHSQLGRKPAAVWQMLPNRRRLFWSLSPGPSLYRRAAEIGASIVAPDVGPRNWDTYLRVTPPQQVLAALCDKAKPWQELLTAEIVKRDDTELDAWCAQFLWDAAAWQKTADALDSAERSRIRQMLDRWGCGRSVISRRRRVVETTAGWQLADNDGGPGELVSDTVIRVDQVVYSPRCGRTYYRGRLVHKGCETAFLDDLKDIESDPAAWLRTTALLAQRPVPIVQPGWERRLLTLALQFHTPTTHTSPAHFGWDASSGSFVFPAYTINSSGWSPHEFVPTGDIPSPGSTLPAPGRLECMDLSRVTADAAGTHLLVATTAAVLANLLAPVYEQRPCGIVAVGDAAAVAPAALALGCLAASANDKRGKFRFDDSAHGHGWPLLLGRIATADRRAEAWLLEESPKNCIVGADELAAVTLWARGNWHILKPRQAEAVSPIQATAMGSVLPNYLLDLCRRNMDLAACASRPYVDRVLEDLRGFVARLGAETDSWAGATDCLRSGGANPDVASAFGEVLSRLVNCGEISQIRAGFDSQSLELVHLEDRIFLPYALFNAALRRRRCPPWDTAHITEAAGRSGVLVDVGDYNGAPGWFLQADWWREQYKKWRTGGAGFVRLAGA